jgi:hypothetical protein
VARMVARLRALGAERQRKPGEICGGDGLCLLLNGERCPCGSAYSEARDWVVGLRRSREGVCTDTLGKPYESIMR